MFPPCIGAFPPYQLLFTQLISTPIVPAYSMTVRRSKRPARRRRAATSDVLDNGATAKSMGRVPQKWKEQYRRLSETRDYLINRQNDLVKDASEEQPAFSL